MAELTVPVVGFSTTNAWLSRMIRWATQSSFSHAWFEYTDTDMGDRWILEAGPRGVVRVPFTHAASDGWCNVARFALVEGDLMPALRTAAALCGDKYGYLQAGGVGLVSLLRRCGYRIRNPFANRTKEVCSELVAMGLISMHLPLTETWDHEAMSPDDLYTYCVTKPELFRRVL